MSVLEELRSLSAAEEFFSCLDVSYDPGIVNVARLHILRRMGEYLRGADFTTVDDATARALCRVHLETAYADFVTSSPLEQRVFKVLKDAVAPRSRPFIPLKALTRSVSGCASRFEEDAVHQADADS